MNKAIDPIKKSGTVWPWGENLRFTQPDQDSSWPRITIITPSFNQGQFLEETIRSVLLQDYPNLEYIIIDGGSRDNSVEIIKRYEKWLTYWVSEPDGGQTDAIHKGFSRATGEILGWLNSDDLFYSEALKTVAKAWQEYAPCHFLTGDGDYVSADRKQITYPVRPRSYTFEDLLGFFKGQYLPQPSVFFSCEAYQEVGGANIDLSFGMDLDLWLRLRQLYPLHHIPICLSQLRTHEEAKTWKLNVGVHEEVRQIISRNLQFVDDTTHKRIQGELRLSRAQDSVRYGVNSAVHNQKADAWEYWKTAIKTYPPILLSSASIKILFRLTMPSVIKRKVLKKS